MENKLVDKKSFYKLMAEIFENLHGHVAFMSGVDDKKRYCKIDDDFYKCKVENAFLVDFNMNQIFATSKPISGVKHFGNNVTSSEKKFNPDVLSLVEICDIVEREKEKYPFVDKVPELISTIDDMNSEDATSVLFIDDEVVDLASLVYCDYVNKTINNNCKKSIRIKIK